MQGGITLIISEMNISPLANKYCILSLGSRRGMAKYKGVHILMIF